MTTPGCLTHLVGSQHRTATIIMFKPRAQEVSFIVLVVLVLAFGLVERMFGLG